MKEEKTKLVPLNDQLPIIRTDPEEEIEFASKAAKALKKIVDGKFKKVVINGEQYLEYEDWQTIGRFYNVSAGTSFTKPIMKGEKVWGYEAQSVIRDKNGVIISSAEASCLRDEKNWETKPEFQLKSMAQTRASAKALRNVLAWVVVLAGYKPTPAEEMNEKEPFKVPDGKATKFQIEKIFKLAKKWVRVKDEVLPFIESEIGRKIELKELTSREASQVIDLLLKKEKEQKKDEENYQKIGDKIE